MGVFILGLVNGMESLKSAQLVRNAKLPSAANERKRIFARNIMIRKMHLPDL